MGNFTRDTFKINIEKLKHYVSVRMQQGVPILDADWNEMEDIRKHELQSFLKWFVGNGVPQGNDGFRIIGDGLENDFTIKGGDGTAEGAGRCLVEGWDALIINDVKYSEQKLPSGADPLGPLSPPLSGERIDTVYLDVWEREVNGQEDGNLVNQDIGIETCVRLKREWVVRVAEGTNEPPAPPQGHVYYPLALLKRTSNQNAITQEDLTDLRRTGLAVLSEEITIKNGNVGIGTPDPQAKLHVAGDRVIFDGKGHVVLYGSRDPSAHAYLQLINSPSSGSAWGLKAGGVLVSDTYAYANPGPDDLIVKGKVGIGTNDPRGKLDVNGDIVFNGNSDHQIFSDGYGTRVKGNGVMLELSPNGGGNLYICNNKGDNRIYIEGFSSDMKGSASEILITGASAAPVPKFSVISDKTYISGKVGIGTNEPDATLHIRGIALFEGGSGTFSLYGGVDPVEYNGYLQLLNSVRSANAWGLKAGGVLVSDTYAYANPGKNDLIVKGKVGIGAAIPSEKLAVEGNLAIGNTDSSSYGIQFRSRSDQGLFDDGAYGLHLSAPESVVINIDSNNNGGDIFFKIAKDAATGNPTDANTLVTVLENGNMGIGPTNLSEKLSVNGNIDMIGENRRIYMGGPGGTTFGIAFSSYYRDYGIFYTEGSPDFVSISPNGNSKNGAMNVYGDGNVVVAGNIHAPNLAAKGIDYAEYFESKRGEKIDPGSAVVLDNGKIRLAKKDEIPIGVISASPGIFGGVHIEWPKKYLKDIFGRPITEEYKEEIMVPKKEKVKKERQKMEKKKVKEKVKRTEVVKKKGKYFQVEVEETVAREIEEPVFKEVDLYDDVSKKKIGKHQIPVMETYEEEIDVLDDNSQPVMVGTGKYKTKTRPKINPEYDEKKEYIPREKRPEWNCVGLLGQLPLRKGQPVAPTWIKIKDISKDVELWLVK